MQRFKKIGILGGGQLGKMLIQAGINWHLPIYILEKEPSAPAVPYATQYVKGDFNNYEDVYQFGKKVDILTIEIEHVNVAALQRLKAEGKIIHPEPDKLAIIKDKGLQKLFYQQHELPTADFQLFSSKETIELALKEGAVNYPFVQKTRTEGYDGRGVTIIRSAKDKLLDGSSVVERMIEMEQEIAVIVARNERGEVSAFPPVEMAFNPIANLVEFLVCPARIPKPVAQQATALAISTIEAFEICGLLAVEMFLTKSGELLINEVAPRPHNSGHSTIEGCYTSQYEQHLRAILNLPLGSTQIKQPSVMLNLLGEQGYKGLAHYEGLDECLAMQGVYVHLYGKMQTHPFRKMGHITITDPDVEAAIQKANHLRKIIKVVSQ
jgi:5-(carboxyamino)imidazole ribonucleotide synthase